MAQNIIAVILILGFLALGLFNMATRKAEGDLTAKVTSVPSSAEAYKYADEHHDGKTLRSLATREADRMVFSGDTKEYNQRLNRSLGFLIGDEE